MIRVLIVDDLNLICKALESMFETVPDIEIVGFAHHGKEAIAQIPQLKPDVALIDILMPVMGGIEATKEITKQFPDVKVIAFSTFEDDPTIIEAIKAGAQGYLTKNMSVEDLTSAIRAVHGGSAQLAPGVLESLVKNLQSQSTQTSSPVKTTESIKPKKSLTDNPLFKHGDWATLLLMIGVTSQLPGWGHHLGHAGLLLLVLTLVARSIRFLWDTPMKHRRAIGIFAFAASLAHAIYATRNILGNQLTTILELSLQHQWGLWAGIFSLAAMMPAAVTSFKYFQQKLGKKWRQIHLLTVPALALAVLHTVLIGPHYLADFDFNLLAVFRTLLVIFLGVLTLSMRRKFFWDFLKEKKILTKLTR
jgi:DNA-binding NarL/FixJ family response regulator/DMSO/TMAO reductase YedYZ heme-binding membrane subunit